jgi:hypothetical protein
MLLMASSFLGMKSMSLPHSTEIQEAEEDATEQPLPAAQFQ